MGIILSNNAKFNPYTFDEMLKPLAMATEAYTKTQEGLAELETNANVIKAYLNEHPNGKYASLYNKYINDIEKQADTLSKVGLTPDARQSLIKLKTRYASDIYPIQEAIKRRRELADEQRKALLQNPTLMFQRDFNSVSDESSIDRFLENPDYDYGASYSGALITQQVNQMAAHLANKLRNTSVGSLDKYTKTFLQSYGLSPEEVISAIDNPNDPNNSRVLKAIFDSAIGGVPQELRDKYMEDITHYASQGFWSAIGQDKLGTFEDFGSRLAAQEASQKRLNRLKSTEDPDPTGGYVHNPRPIISAKEQENYEQRVKDFSKYFYKKDGKWRMNEAGRRVYLNLKEDSAPALWRNSNPNSSTIQATPTGSLFKEFLDSLGADRYFFKNGKADLGAIGAMWGNYLEKTKNLNTGTMRMEFYKPIAPSEQQQWKDLILEAASNTGKLYETDMDNKSGIFKTTGKELSLEELNSDDYTVVSRAESTYGDLGNSVFIKDKKGKIKRYNIPSGIHYTAEQDVRNALDNMTQIENALNSDKYTNEQKAQLLNDYQYYSNIAGRISDNIGSAYKVASDNAKPYSW